MELGEKARWEKICKDIKGVMRKLEMGENM
jgi:hypothetical protein